MTVYVDDLMARIPNKRWPFKWSCHMSADTLDELHAMAAKLGLRRAWFQDHPTLAHYDLTSGKRRMALKFGAQYEHIKDTVSRVTGKGHKGDA